MFNKIYDHRRFKYFIILLFVSLNILYFQNCSKFESKSNPKFKTDDVHNDDLGNVLINIPDSAISQTPQVNSSDLTAPLVTLPTESFTTICTVDDFNKIRANLSGNYKVVCDIDFKGVSEWAAIGHYHMPFLGIIEGNGHTLSNFSNSRGLFHVFAGAVRNLNISHFVLNPHTTDQNSLAFGLLIDDLGDRAARIGKKAIVENINIKNSQVILDFDKMRLPYFKVGGLVGIVNSQSEITNSTIEIKMTDRIVDGQIYNIISDGIGLVAGKLFSSTISNTKVKGAIEFKYAGSQIENVGGVVGYFAGERNSNSILSENYLEAQISIPLGKKIGGLVGFAFGPSLVNKIQNCHFEGVVIGHHKIGGLIGDSLSTAIVSSSSKSIVKGANIVGGLVGAETTSIFIDKSFFEGEIISIKKTMQKNVHRSGGLIGGLAVTESGFSGCARSVAIQDSYVNALIKSESNYASGLIGAMSLCLPSAHGSFIRNVYFSGSVLRSDNTTFSDILISEVTSRGNGPRSNEKLIFNTENVFWNSQLNNKFGSQYGKPVIFDSNLSKNLSSWDFVNIWEMNDTLNLPILKKSKNYKKIYLPRNYISSPEKISSTRKGILYAIGLSGLIHSTDQGKTWVNKLENTEIEPWNIRQAWMNDEGLIVVATINQGLFISTDNGVHYYNSNINNGLTSNNVLAFKVDNRNFIYAINESGDLVISKNFGRTFILVNLEFIQSLLIKISSEHSLAVSLNGTIYMMLGNSFFRSQINGLNNIEVLSDVKKIKFYQKHNNQSNASEIVVDEHENIYIGSSPLTFSTDHGETFEVTNAGTQYYNNFNNIFLKDNTIYFIGRCEANGINCLYRASTAHLKSSTPTKNNKIDFISLGQAAALPGAGSIGTITADKDNNILGFTFWQGFLKSTDGGNTFKQIN